MIIISIMEIKIYLQMYTGMLEYKKVKESSIKTRLIRHSTVKKLLKQLESSYKVSCLGYSVLGKEIFSIEVGTGDINILLWSQMHGNESTATASIFDILNYFLLNTDNNDIKKLTERYKFTFVPMLNPDGAENWTRVNAMNIDINRDAIAQNTPEGRILWDLIKKINPEYSFNLHDQRNIFSVGANNNTATISFLSASFDKDRNINKDRELTMSLIVKMNEIIQEIIPNCVGRYTDEFYPTATGDNLHRLGYKNILIESGTYPNDPERQMARKANFMAIIGAFEYIMQGVKLTNLSEYIKIPLNKNNLFDLIVRNVNIEQNGVEAMTDIGIMYNEKPNEDYRKMIKKSRIENIGDLSNYKGIKELDAKGEIFNCDKLHYAELNQEATFNIGDLFKIDNGEEV